MLWIRKTQPIARVLASGLLVTALSGCHAISSSTGAGVGGGNSFTIPHELRYSTDEDIVGLNPWFNQQLTLSYMAEMTMAWLFRYDHNNQLIPELATIVPSQKNGGISADGKTIVFHLRHDARWSDGVPFTAQDVVFSFQQVLNPRNNVVSRDGWDRIDRLEAPDAYTVKLHLKKPYAEFEPTFFSTGGANPCILPKHILAGRSSLNEAPYNSLPVGIGPFKYLRWDRANEVVLVPNDTYFRGRPKLDRVIFKIIPDANTVMTQLQSGEIDLWIPARSYYIDRLRQLSGYRAVRQPSYQFGHLDFNLKNPALADPAVRMAIRASIDRPTMKAKISHGFGILQESYLSPSYPNVPKPIAALPFDLHYANALLDHAGWKRGTDGVRAKGSQRLHFIVAVGTASPDTDAMLELMRTWWQAIGLSIEVRHFASPVLFATYQNGGIISAGKYDMTLFAWQVDALDNMLDILGCRQVPPAGQNNTRYCNPQADALMQAFNETYDPAAQRKLKGQLMTIFVHDVPMVVLSVRENLYVANRDLKGFAPNQVSAFDDMLNVDI